MDSLAQAQSKVFNHYGIDNQLLQLCQEAAEVIDMATRYMIDKNHKLLVGEIKEEIADLLNLLEQFRDGFYEDGTVRELQLAKMRRQLIRIEADGE